MRTKWRSLVTTAVIAVFTFISCEGPTGPEGPAGPEGSPDVQTVLLVYLTENKDIPADETTTVEFDEVEVDELDGHDTSTGVYTVQTDGDYHLAATIRWATTLFDPDDEINYEVKVNDTVELRLDSDGASPDESFSTSLPNLTTGDTVEVTIHHNSAGSRGIVGGIPHTRLTIDRLN